MVETAGVNLIHMNGRIYDPTIGRFLQPDPVIQAPDNPQSWNAYTYVFNNPLAYTDPTGMIGMKERQWLGAIVAIVAVVCQQYWALDGAAAFFYAAGVGAVVGGITTGTWRGAAIGAFSGAVTWGIATYVPGTYQVLAQAVSGGVMESLQGGNFGHGFVAAGLTASVMPEVGQITNDAERVLTGALVGGTLSEITDGNFANGAVSGAIQAAMAGQDAESEDQMAGQRRGRWSAGKVKDILNQSEVGTKFLSDLHDSEVEVMSFEGASDTYSMPKGRSVVKDLSDALQGNYKDGIIRLNIHMTNSQAALTLYHEYQHHLGFNEVDARIRTEQFAIEGGYGVSSPGYRTAAGTVDSQFIRSELAPGGSLSFHYNAGPRTRRYWGERNVAF